VTRSTYINAILMGRGTVFRLVQGNKIAFWQRKFRELATCQNSTRTEQGCGLLTISVHVARQVSTRTEQGCGLLTISVHVARQISTRTEQGCGLLTISVHVAESQFTSMAKLLKGSVDQGRSSQFISRKVNWTG